MNTMNWVKKSHVKITRAEAIYVVICCIIKFVGTGDAIVLKRVIV